MLIFVGCKNENNENDPVSSSQKSTYVITAGGELLRTEQLFDTSGSCIKEIQFGSRIEDTIKIIKNSFKDSLLLQSRIYGAKNKLLQTISYVYQNGTLENQYSIKGGDTLTISYFTYFQNGRLQREVTEYPGNVKNPIITVTNYNRKGDIETIYKQIYEDSTQRVLARYELSEFRNEYAENSKKLIQVIATQLFGYYEIKDTVFIINYDYDVSGNRVLQKYKKNTTQGEPDSIRYHFSDNNLLMDKIVYTTKGNSSASTLVADTMRYTYDEKGRLTSEKNAEGLGFRYSYIKK